MNETPRGHQLAALLAITASLLVVLSSLFPDKLDSGTLFPIIAVLGALLLIAFSSLPQSIKLILTVTVIASGGLLIYNGESLSPGLRLSLKVLIVVVAIASWLKRGKTLSTTEKQ